MYTDTRGEGMNKFKKIMKIVLKVLGVLLALLLIAIIGLVIYFWPFLSSLDWSVVTPGNIKALYVAFTNDTETLIANEKALDEKRAEDIKNYVSVDIRDLTEEELAQVESGERTKTQIVAEIIAESVKTEEPTEVTQENKSGNEQENNNPAKEEKPQQTAEDKKPENKESADAIVARHIANLYAIQSDFETRVNDLALNARNWLHAYKNAMNVTWKEAKVAAVKHYSSTASAIESDCYARVDAEIASLEADLKAINADLSIVDVVRDSAYEEMELKKAKIVNEGTAKLNKE